MPSSDGFISWDDSNPIKSHKLKASVARSQALWLRTDCFRRFSALADLCLLGEGQGAARGVPCILALRCLETIWIIAIK